MTGKKEDERGKFKGNSVGKGVAILFKLSKPEEISNFALKAQYKTHRNPL